MSTHLIHILQHGSYLSVDRGCLVCKCADAEHRMPLADILAVIVAARGVAFSSDSLSALMAQGAVVLHCDHNYRPIGKTVGLNKIVHAEAIECQLRMNSKMAENVWNKILRKKIENQAHLLDYLQVNHKLWEYLSLSVLDEGNAARHYWGFYFKNFGRSNPQTRQRRGAEDPVNGMLNYGYAVIGAIVQRSLLAHGLNTTIGVHHKGHFKSDPLVYDVIEPLRPICDFMLLRYRQSAPKAKIEDWVKSAAQDIMQCKIKTPDGKYLKLIQAVDVYATALSNFYRFENENFYIPSIKEVCFGEN